MYSSKTSISHSASGPASTVEALRAARVAVLSTPACPYCKRAKEALTSAGISFVDVDVGSDGPLRARVRELTGSRTVPQIFLAGASLGGCDDLLAALAGGTFAARLAAAEAAGAAALPGELVDLVAADAARRASHAAASPSSPSPSAALPERLRELESRMRGSSGGLLRREARVGSRTLRVFTPAQMLSWLAAAGEPDPAAAARQLAAANRLSVAAAEPAEAAPAITAAAAASARASAAAEQPPQQEVLLTLVADAPAAVAGEPLNAHYWWQGPARPANEVAAELRALVLQLYDAHLSPDGRALSYGALRADLAFGRFVDATAELQKVDLAPLSRAELTAFAINTYNALIVHAMAGLGLTRMGAAQRASFYSRTANYIIGGLVYTADDLEQGVLRGNRAGASHPANLLGLYGLAGGHWRAGDPRVGKGVVFPPDPRIHFALVCGARSCPPIKLYTPDSLEEGLAGAAEAFCAGEVAVDEAARTVTLSKIFKWYAPDFGADQAERLATIAQWLPEGGRAALRRLLAERGGRGVRLAYKEYDWGLNGTD